MSTRVTLKIDSKEYVHTFGDRRSEASVREWMQRTLSPGTELVRIENALEQKRDLIVPTHAPTTAAEHNKFPKGRW